MRLISEAFGASWQGFTGYFIKICRIPELRTFFPKRTQRLHHSAFHPYFEHMAFRKARKKPRGLRLQFVEVRITYRHLANQFASLAAIRQERVVPCVVGNGRTKAIQEKRPFRVKNRRRCVLIDSNDTDRFRSIADAANEKIAAKRPCEADLCPC